MLRFVPDVVVIPPLFHERSKPAPSRERRRACAVAFKSLEPRRARNLEKFSCKDVNLWICLVVSYGRHVIFDEQIV
jgi:hypothetical protein